MLSIFEIFGSERHFGFIDNRSRKEKDSELSLYILLEYSPRYNGIIKMKKLLNSGILLMIVSLSYAQAHWESIILSSDSWKYLPSISEAPSDWNSKGFDDRLWSEGPGGIGYSDDDDATIIEKVNSLYLRKSFDVSDPNDIESLILDIDYDDAFVAYLNGVEIARSANVTEANPTYNSMLSFDREAIMVDGGAPERHLISEINLLSGVNVLAVHILNFDFNSSDLSSIIFLHAGIISEGLHYNSPPSWFKEPISFESSKLPLVFITTNGEPIVDDPRIIAHMGIINNGKGEINYVTDSLNEYAGRISIEVRGQSSQMFPKKSFALETQDELGENLNVPLLDMPSENDWILYAPYTDKSMLRNALTFELGKQLDSYCSRMAFCELFLNDEYQGVYILMEKIKKDQNRVNISTLSPTENSGDNLTGGYIFKVDKIDSDYRIDVDGFLSQPQPSYPNAMDIVYQYVYPEADVLSSEQSNYLKEYIKEAEEVIISDYFDDPEIGYNRYLNIGSFVDFLLINEISKEVDKYRFSNYFYKKKESKGDEIFAGPIWDFNLGYGNVDYWTEGLYTNGWLYEEVYSHDWSIIFWWKRLMEDSWFEDLVATRWTYLRQNEFSDARINQIIDSILLLTDDAQVRNYERWPILGTYVWPNYNWENNSYQDEVSYFKNWLFARLDWMDNNVSGDLLTPSLNMQKGEASGGIFYYKLFLTDEQFNNRQLRTKYFDIASSNSALIVDSVYYENPTYATLALKGENGVKVGGSVFSLTIDDKILNGFKPLLSENLELGTENEFAVPDYDMYVSSGTIYIQAENPGILPDYIEVFSILGRLVRKYPLQKAMRNEIVVDLPSDFYVARITTQTGTESVKLLITRE